MMDEISNERYPSKTFVYYQIGTYYHYAKEYRIALRYFQKSLAMPLLVRHCATLIAVHNTSGLCYANLGEYDNALACYRKILDNEFFRQYHRYPEWEVIVNSNIADIQVMRGNYAEAIPVFKHTINYLCKGDIIFTIGTAIALSEVFLKTGQTDSARCYMQQWLIREQIPQKHLNYYFSLMSLYYEKTGNAALTVAYRDSLRLNEQRERENLATVSTLLEKKEEKTAEIIEKEKSLIQHRKNLLFALTGVVLLSVIIVIVLINRRKIHRKNVALVQQIHQLLALQKIKENELLQKTTFQTPPGTAVPSHDEPDVADLCPESRKDKLYLALRDLLLKEKVYRQYTLSRDGLAERLYINRHNLDDAFQHCFGMHYAEYINELRLRDAVAMLEQSDLSVLEISEKAGFGTLRTFQRQFTAQYNMSPKNYRAATGK
jgi:AraC-like DNA-binding protein